uniref:Uncharacterized protein n=1 Tax=Glossina austeni TaxID=7395 RepID=A0A1A9VV44_GLOAU
MTNNIRRDKHNLAKTPHTLAFEWCVSIVAYLFILLSTFAVFEEDPETDGPPTIKPFPRKSRSCGESTGGACNCGGGEAVAAAPAAAAAAAALFNTLANVFWAVAVACVVPLLICVEFEAIEVGVLQVPALVTVRLRGEFKAAAAALAVKPAANP